MGKGRSPVSSARLRVVLAIGGLLTAMSVFTAPPVAAATGIAAQAERGTLQINYVSTKDGTKALPTISGAMATGLREAYLGSQAAAAAQAPATAAEAAAGAAPNIGLTTRTLGCSARNSDGSVRVNQDCSYRRQAEETIRFNPANPNNLVAGQNDSRIGYNHCGIDYSTNNGQTWGDMLPPFWQKENDPQLQADATVTGDPNRHTITGMPGTDRTYDFASDPVIAVDAEGRSFFGCVVISLGANEGDNAADNSTGLLVAVSPPGVGGAFYNNIAAETKKYTVAEDNDPNIFHDKPFIAADYYPHSPNRDNVYMTWTVFRSNFPACSNPVLFPVNFCSAIYGSMSTDHGRTWSTPKEISGVSNNLCGGSCNQDQGSDPVVLPDGSVVVTYNNGNTPSTVNQTLAVTCHPSGSSPAGSAAMNCGVPALVGPDVATGEPTCNFGRGPEECIPGARIRTNDFPRIAVNRSNGHVFVTWQDYATGRFDIQLAESRDGGATWTQAKKPVSSGTTQDNYFPAIDVAAAPTGGGGDATKSEGENGDHVGVSYYRTDRIPNESTVPAAGFSNQPGVGAELSDYVLAGGNALHTPYAIKVLTPKFVPPDGNQAGFNGDYSGLTIVNDTAHPIWSDTRNTSPFPASSPDFQGVIHDEDIFTVATSLPGGGGGGGGGG
jgi:hypothetical protein